jgi:hypothetical protein
MDMIMHEKALKVCAASEDDSDMPACAASSMDRLAVLAMSCTSVLSAVGAHAGPRCRTSSAK